MAAICCSVVQKKLARFILLPDANIQTRPLLKHGMPKVYCTVLRIFCFAIESVIWRSCIGKFCPDSER